MYICDPPTISGWEAPSHSLASCAGYQTSGPLPVCGLRTGVGLHFSLEWGRVFLTAVFQGIAERVHACRQNNLASRPDPSFCARDVGQQLVALLRCTEFSLSGNATPLLCLLHETSVKSHVLLVAHFTEDPQRRDSVPQLVRGKART